MGIVLIGRGGLLIPIALILTTKSFLGFVSDLVLLFVVTT